MSYSVSLNVKLDSNNMLCCKEIINLLLKTDGIFKKNSNITFFTFK